MQSFNQIIDTLKTITSTTTDKALAIELHIKPSSYASMKRRQKIPFKSILGYCRARRINQCVCKKSRNSHGKEYARNGDAEACT